MSRTPEEIAREIVDEWRQDVEHWNRHEPPLTPHGEDLLLIDLIAAALTAERERGATISREIV